MIRTTLSHYVDLLEAHFGKQKPPKLDGPWEMILWENVAYLADDDRRQQAFQTLKKRIGTEPTPILSASDEALLEVTRHGIMPEQFAEKLRKCAKLALEEFDGDLRLFSSCHSPRPRRRSRDFRGLASRGQRRFSFSPGPAPCWLWSRTACVSCCAGVWRGEEKLRHDLPPRAEGCWGRTRQGLCLVDRSPPAPSPSRTGVVPTI